MNRISVEWRLRNFFSSDLSRGVPFDLWDHIPRIGIVPSEIKGWITSLDQCRSGKSTDQLVFLSLCSSKATTLDRKATEPSYCNFPVARVFSGIEPDLGDGLQNEAQGRDELID